MFEAGESPEQAVLRELREELAVDIEPGPLVAVYTLRVPGAAYGLRFVFRSRIIAGEPSNAAPDEVAEFGWFDPSALPRPMTHTGPFAVADTTLGHLGMVREITATMAAP
jgi:8-oxo-dGTP diphosphatase